MFRKKAGLTVKKTTYLQAFSLIELLVVITIVGILSTLGVSSYSDYVHRSRMAGAMASFEALEPKILECYTLYGQANCTNGQHDLPTLDEIKKLPNVSSGSLEADKIKWHTTGVSANGVQLGVIITYEYVAKQWVRKVEGGGCSAPRRGIECNY